MKVTLAKDHVLKNIAVCGFLALLSSSCATPAHLYLTWQGDTSTTMTINYHTGAATAESTVRYDTSPHDGHAAEYPQATTGDAHQIPGLKDGRYVHSVELTGLTPGTRYYFVADSDADGFTSEHSFRTLPDDGSDIRFIDAGDTAEFPRTLEFLKLAAAQNPNFMEIGGDLAYENGDLGNYQLSDLWLTNYESAMVTSEGCMIPMVVAIGNHEVNGADGAQEERAPFYFGYFPQGGSSYFTRKIGRDAVMFVLDSGHIAPHDGAQCDWLAAQLEENKHARYLMATYHVPLYPSFRPFDYDLSAAGRAAWLPLFDQYSMTVCFEHHDHTFKRTKLLRGGQEDATGTLYLGDGCMGQFPRIPDTSRWYLAKAEARGYFWIVDITKDGLKYQAMNILGNVFDTYP